MSSLGEFITTHRRLWVLTGAGISTGSGIPAYRDERGVWKQRKPIYYQDFIRSLQARQRYWARSMLGWPRIAAATPHRSHLALAALERSGRIHQLTTQNVDRLHQQAGSRQVIELHGSLQQVVCLGCGTRLPRAAIQRWLLERNSQLQHTEVESAPDGDAWLESIDFNSLQIPDCEQCGGVLKPDVVFFGENVPAVRVERCFTTLQQADAVLVIGSSLMVYSGYRFVRRAHELGLPIVAVNRGVTRADDLLSRKFEHDCGTALEQALEDLY